MDNNDRPLLRSHRLLYLGDLGIHDTVFRARFPNGCTTNHCNANCCKGGVWVDAAERDAIIASAKLVQAHMEAPQEHNPERWFKSEILKHSDFASEEAVRTAVHEGACVFLDSGCRCVLQVASVNQTPGLKPFFCLAFPITIENRELAVDKGFHSECCTTVEDGPLGVFEAFSKELEYVLGEAGVRELEDMVKRNSGQQSQ